MKNSLTRASTRSCDLLAAAAGLLLAASFPEIGIAGFAWIAPGLILLAALGTRQLGGFRVGYIAGLAFYLGSLWWLLLIPYRWHGIPFGPALGWVLLSAYLSLYPATWAWLCTRISRVLRPLPDESERVVNWLGLLREISAWSWSRRAFWAFRCAAIWVAVEIIVSRFLGGFPWNLLGVSQYKLVPLIQVASVTGVYGVSFVVVWASVSLLCALAVIVGRPGPRAAWVPEIILPFVVLVVLFGYGFDRLEQAPAPARELHVTMIQPSIPQTLIWNPENDAERFQALIRLTEQALTNRTDLLVWPESAIPKMLRYDEGTYRAVTGLAREHHVWMIVGSDDAERVAGSTNPEDVRYYNSSFLISPEGELAAGYRKQHLVVFGEYIPLVRWFPFLKWFTPIRGGFTPGIGAIQFRMPDLDAQTSVLICFEDSFPKLARAAVEPHTDFLVNLTNDGWFGKSAAQWQHAANALFRSVENGLPLVRCTNTGLTCWIDSCGRMRAHFTDSHGSIYGTGFLTANIPLLPVGQVRSPTFYNRHGDWFGWSCLGIAVLSLILRKSVGSPPEEQPQSQPGAPTG